MPSFRHEAPLYLLRERPDMIAALLRDGAGVRVPAFHTARITEPDFTQLVPTEFRADLVICLEGDATELGVIIELQRARDDRKRRSWPLYAAALHARLASQTCLIVIAESEEVAAWARTPIDTVQPGSPFSPLVLGPGKIPRVTDDDAAAACPELAVLSSLVHGNGTAGLDVLRPTVKTLAGVDTERATFYLDMIVGALGEVALRALEQDMRTRGYEYQSDFARKYFGQGEQAQLERARKALLGIVVGRNASTDEIAARVEAIDDIDELMRLAVAVGTAADADDIAALFADDV